MGTAFGGNAVTALFPIDQRRSVDRMAREVGKTHPKYWSNNAYAHARVPAPRPRVRISFFFWKCAERKVIEVGSPTLQNFRRTRVALPTKGVETRPARTRP